MTNDIHVRVPFDGSDLADYFLGACDVGAFEIETWKYSETNPA